MEKEQKTYKRFVADSPVKVVFTTDDQDRAICHPSFHNEIEDQTFTIRALKEVANDSSDEQVPTIFLPFNPACTEYVAKENACIVLPPNLKYAPEIKLEAHAGRIMAESVSCYQLTVDTSSGGTLTIGGNAFIVKLNSSSGSQVKARYLVCSAFVGDANSGATVEITVEKKIIADAFNGTITYYCINDLEKKITGQRAYEQRIELKLGR